MADGPSNVSGTMPVDEVAQLTGEIRAMNFAKNLLYSSQFSEIIPLIEELEDYEDDDPRIQIIDAVLSEALKTFPLADCDV